MWMGYRQIVFIQRECHVRIITCMFICIPSTQNTTKVRLNYKDGKDSVEISQKLNITLDNDLCLLHNVIHHMYIYGGMSYCTSADIIIITGSSPEVVETLEHNIYLKWCILEHITRNTNHKLSYK